MKDITECLPQEFYTANDISREVTGKLYTEEDVIKAMMEYAVQFMNMTKCYKCEGVGSIITRINPDGGDYSEICNQCNGAGKYILLPTITTTGT